jgi:peptidoglycan/LPS O-acetylase OafA/YrhL
MNFDYIRLFLAVTVLTGHVGWSAMQLGPYWNSELAVFCFFCISGYLITGSFRSNPDLRVYATKRVARIYPPIVATVSVLWLAGFATKQGSDFFHGSFALLLFQDWLILGPGFLEMSPYGHGAFWTLVVEAQFYAFLPAVLALLAMRPKVGVAVLLAGYLLGGRFMSSIDWSSLLSLPWHQNVFTVCQYFIAGLLAAIYLPSIHEKRWFVPVALPLGAVMFAYGISSQFFHLIMPLALCLLVLSVARVSSVVGRKAPWGDLSYGVYLYHFPIASILTLVGLSSSLAIVGLTFFAAFVSWHLLERPSIRWASGHTARLTAEDRAV